ncbi:MAG: Clp protease ClpP [Firmicutes bacterium]|nr:Clp protease ClpP [Bacillota bacterium]
MKKFNFLNIAIDEQEIDIYISGDIVADNEKELYDYFGVESTSPNEFKQLLQDNAGKNLTVHINSRGGNIFAGVAMYNALMDYKGNTTAVVEGIVASAATLPMVACNKVRMMASSVVMIHCSSVAWTAGNKQQLKQDIKTLETIDDAMANAYELKTGLSHDKILKMMADETWMDAKEAKRLGFVDEIPFELPQDLVASMVASHKAIYAQLVDNSEKLNYNIKLIQQDYNTDFEYLKAKNTLKTIGV